MTAGLTMAAAAPVPSPAQTGDRSRMSIPFGDVDALLSALAQGDTVHDEPGFDVLAHSLQCGALLRAEHPDDPELAAAGLVHDVWDAVVPDDHHDHDVRGAALVEPLLGARTARLVAGHVVAKRYLVATEREYADGLSDRSVETLADQGGALDAQELARVAASPDFDALLALRRADERAKVPGAIVPDLTSWRDLLLAVSRGTRAPRT
jgi:predicted HD phosphohydrolase